MPAKSKEQQRLFGMVHAYQKGELEDASQEVKGLADDMSYKSVKDFAETKHKGLPEKVKSKKNESMDRKVIKISESTLHQIVSESVKRVLTEMYDFASEKPQYDINSDEYGKEYDAGLAQANYDPDDKTDKEISDYESLPDKARHPYGGDFPDFSERLKNRGDYNYRNADKLAQKEPGEVLRKQEDKRNFEKNLATAKKGSLLFHLWCKENNIDPSKLSDEELVNAYFYCLDEFRDREDRRREEYDY